MEAVTQYMLKNDIGIHSNNVRDMGIDQRVAVGLAALQEANHTGVPVKKHIMDAFRRELGVHEGETPEESAILDDANEFGPLSFVRLHAGKYSIHCESVDAHHRLGSIQKMGRQWLLDFEGHRSRFKSLKLAKDEALAVHAARGGF